MRWWLEAAAHNTLSYLPSGGHAHYLLQRHVARSLPVHEEAFRQKAARAVEHLRAWEEHGPPRELADAELYEFGAGWDLIVPLTLHALGAGRQTVVDLRPNVRPELVSDTLAKLERHRGWLAQEAGRPTRALDTRPLASVAELRGRFGIAYLAPADARATRLPAACVDLVTSTNTLEHVPPPDIVRILRECRRLLRPDGIVTCRIDLEDHYARSDPRLSRYHFLRFSDRAWRVVNAPLSFLNRLRYPDYLRLFAEAGLEIVAQRVSRPSDADLEALRRLDLAPRFRRYSLEEVGARALAVVARPAASLRPF